MTDENEHEMTDEDYELAQEGEMRVLVGEVMRESYLADDQAEVEKALTGLQTAHDYSHFSLGEIRKEMGQSVIQLDFEGLKREKLHLALWNEIHFAIEYLELVTRDHLRHLKGDHEESGAGGDFPIPATSFDISDEELLKIVKVRLRRMGPRGMAFTDAMSKIIEELVGEQVQELDLDGKILPDGKSSVPVEAMKAAGEVPVEFLLESVSGGYDDLIVQLVELEKGALEMGLVNDAAYWAGERARIQKHRAEHEKADS